MAELTTEERKRIPTNKFGVINKTTGERSYPMPNRAHAQNEKARATQMVNAGKLSPEKKAQIDKKANRILGEKGGE